MKKLLLLCFCFVLILISCSSIEDLPEDLTVFLINEDEFVKEPPIHQRQVIAGDFDTVVFESGGIIMSRKAILSIRKNALYLIHNSTINVLLEGYCDNSGTIAFNLALGQKRALSVKRLYVILGVKSNRIATISYGKENQISPRPELNRRVETKILTNKLIDIRL
jgi:outer membrane protein OmpA-like peptidoglycan-associated protein